MTKKPQNNMYNNNKSHNDESITTTSTGDNYMQNIHIDKINTNNNNICVENVTVDNFHIDNIKSLPRIYSGKVRDLYNIDDKKMLMVASDRLSTFDIILNQAIPKKGIYLTQISLFWFNYLNDIKNHLTNYKLEDFLTGTELEYAQGRAVIVNKLKPVPIEAIVRGYLAGSGYKDYLKHGAICGISLPPHLRNAEKLPYPIFTPSTKAQIGDHDENITMQQCKNIIGAQLTEQIQQTAIEIYQKASELALKKGIIIADTKFEFGLNDDGELVLMDEVLTPDSSRFWNQDEYIVGTNPPSFDKQFVRDYLELELCWNKQPPIPDLPAAIIQKTVDKYYEIIKRLGIE
ncbi:MAG: phosphoribosylaminoimidazole-succinocarboxamide synthase [Pseudomonadota bacterium]|nr:phosphoribosylaminoimidazole-succinocarboxamide synthase [Pseudomonadota bacterium]